MPRMPGRKTTGEYGAQGDPASKHIAAQIDEYAMSGGIASSPESDRGFFARLNYLVKRKGGGGAMERNGVRPRTLRDWRSGRTKASRANRERVDRAYQELRRENMMPRLKHELRQRQIEITPVNQGNVPRPRQRTLNVRRKTLRSDQWDAILNAWEDGDFDTIQDVYDDAIAEDDTDYSAYANVAYVGF